MKEKMMKKCLLTTAFLLCGSFILYAAGLKAGAVIDFTDYLGMQSMSDYKGTTTWTDVTVRRSPWYTSNTFGRQDIYFRYDSDDWDFYTSLRFDLGQTSIGEAHVTAKLDDGAIKLRTGAYQEESFGYSINSFSNGVMGRYLAGVATNTNYHFLWQSDSQYLFSVDYTPDFISGLSVLAGIPVEPHGSYFTALPTSSTETQSMKLSNTLYRFKLAAKYDLPFGESTLKATYQNALYSNFSSDPLTRTSSHYVDSSRGIDDAFIGIDNYKLLPELILKGGYEFQYDQASLGTAVQNRIFVSAAWDMLPELRLSCDNVLTLESGDWANANVAPGAEDTTQYTGTAMPTIITSSMVGYDMMVLNGTYTMSNINFSLTLIGGYEPKTNGQLPFAYYGQAYAKMLDSGNAGSSYCVGLNPSVGIKVGPATASLGVDLGYIRNTGSTYTSSAFGWRVPLNFKCAL